MEADNEVFSVPEWEKSKENVQPRKQGRIVEKLNLGLCAKSEVATTTKLKKEKEKYESSLRSYEGDDPLSVWHEYINWTEENYPSGGKTSQVLELISSCVKHFGKIDQYNNDERYIHIWIRFSNMCQEPLEVYRHMNSRGIGTRSATFYKAWALSTEEHGQSKMADQIFLQGIENGAEPVDELKTAREEFQTRTCRALMEKMSTSDDLGGESGEGVSGPQRQALVALEVSSRGRVFSDRVSSSQPELSVTNPTQTRNDKITALQKPLEIFEDDRLGRDTAPISGATGKFSALPDNRIANENTRAPAKWNQSAYKNQASVRGSIQPIASSASVEFNIHCDAADNKAKQMPSRPATGVGLSVKKPDKKSATAATVALSDHPLTHIITTTEPNEIIQERPMYNKTKVYAGLSEFSIEELRAIKWRQALEKKQAEQEAADKQARQHELLASQLEHHRSQLDYQFEQYRAKLAQELLIDKQTMQKQMEIKLNEVQQFMSEYQRQMDAKIRKMEEELNQLRSDSLLQKASSNEIDGERTECRLKNTSTASSTTSHASSASMSYKTPRADTTNSITHSHSTVTSKRHRTPDTSSAKRSLMKAAASPYGVTQDCARLMNGFFNQTLSVNSRSMISKTLGDASQESMMAAVDNPTSGAVSSAAASSAAASGLVIFTDPDPVPQQVPGFTVFNDGETAVDQQQQPATAANFPIHTDPNEAADKPKLSAFSVYTDDHAGSAFSRPSRLNPQNEPIDNARNVVKGFAVFTDENNVHMDQENRRVPDKPLQRDETASKAAGADTMEYHTYFDMDTKFAQQAQSTPFYPSSGDGVSVGLPDPAVSEIRQDISKKNRPLPAPAAASKRTSITPIDFAPTQILSPICEQSRESNSSNRSAASYGSTVSSMARSRSRSSGGTLSSESESHITTADIPGEHLMTSAKSRTLHHQPSAPALDVVNEESGELLQKISPVIDTTYYQPPEITEAVLNTTVFIDSSNPFSEAIQSKVLRKINIGSYDNVTVHDKNMPKLKVGTTQLKVSDFTVKLVSKLGTGGFASTYEAIVIDAPASKKNSLSTTTDTVELSTMSNYTLNTTQYKKSDRLCMKIQKPACPWELYICRELRNRFSCMDEDMERDIPTRIMDVTHALFYNDASVMANELVTFGSLLSLTNALKAKRTRLSESLMMYITIELLHTVEVIHRCSIIHGDLKPDNVLFLGFPTFEEGESYFSNTSIKVIDFGRGIDMSKFAKGTTFTANNETEGFMCIEMKTERPWTYQTDLFGLLATVYPLLYHSYMKVHYVNNRWVPTNIKLPRNFLSKLWVEMYDEFLNIPSCDDIPCVSEWRERFEAEFQTRIGEYNTQSVQINSSLGIVRPSHSL